MYQKELQEIGLSLNESKVYEVVLEEGETSVSKISKKAQIHRTSIYDIVKRLEEKGLLFSIFHQKENLYAAALPDQLLLMMREKEKTLKKIIPGLEFLKQKSPIKESAFIYRGQEGYRNYIADRMRISEDTYFLGAKGNWCTDQKSLELEKKFQKRIKQKGKEFKILFDPRVKERQDILKTTPAEYKFLPEGFDTPGVVDVFGDHVVTFNNKDSIGKFGEKGLIFVMVSPDLAETYKKWFKMIWNFCE